MMTLATTFKPFLAEDGINQLNALASWRALGADVQILAFGETPGLCERASQFGIEQGSDVPLSIEGLPRVDRILDAVSRTARYELIAYLNGDILLTDDFVKALGSIPLPRFLMVGQRTDVDVPGLLDLTTRESRDKNLADLAAKGRLHRVAGLDYFAFRRGSLPPLPPLYAGAAGWDNVTVYLCRRYRVPVVDATLDVTVLHPNHRYRRLDTGQRLAFDGETAGLNYRNLPAGVPRFYTTDANYWLEGGRLRSAISSPRHAWRLVYTSPIIRGWGGAARLPFRVAGGVLKRLGFLWMLVFWRKSRERRRIRAYELSYRRLKPGAATIAAQ